MKLRNKKTGEIGYLYEHSLVQDIIIVYDVKGIVGKYNSLAELNSEWEDYEEPEEYYFIADFGGICARDKGKFVEDEEDRKQIGNYFETKEEAEKAVEKLKAWKRLKDRGFRVIDYGDEDIRYEIKDRYDGCLSDLETVLFGGEE